MTIEEDMADLKAICSRILDQYAAQAYDLPETKYHGLTAEEYLSVIVDDIVPEIEVNLPVGEPMPCNFTSEWY